MQKIELSRNKKICILSICIITIVIIFCIFTNKMIFQSLRKGEENEKLKLEQKDERQNELEGQYDIQFDYIFISRTNQTYHIKFSVSSNSCIRKIENVETGEKQENDFQTNGQILSLESAIDKGKDYKIEITMANGTIIQKTFNMDIILSNNHAPTTPKIIVWPEEATIKKGRNLTLKAESTDPDGDTLEYEWEGRTAETAIYSVGSHTVRVRAIDVYGTESEWVSYNFNVIDVEATTLSYEVPYSGNNFNIRGNTNRTTYSDAGYTSILLVNGQQTPIVGTASFAGITVVTNLDPIYDGNYVKISYKVTNDSEARMTIGIATHADIMISSNDSAPIYNIAGNRGFIMTDGTYNYKVMLRDTENVTNVDTYWFGHYNSRTANMWNNSNIEALTGVDSGMAFSWKDRIIEPGETQTYSVIIGLE